MGCYHPGKRIAEVHVKQSQSFDFDKVFQVDGANLQLIGFLVI